MAKYVQPNFIVDSSASFLKNVTFDSSVYLQGVTHISNPTAATAGSTPYALVVDSLGTDITIKSIQLGTMAYEPSTKLATIDASIVRIDASLNDVIDIFTVIDASLATKVNKSGDTMTGTLVFAASGFTLDGVTITNIDTSAEGLGAGLDTHFPTSGAVKAAIDSAIAAGVTADNGLTESPAGNIQLGGALSKATTITTTDSSTLAITGLNASTNAFDAVMVGSTGILYKHTLGTMALEASSGYYYAAQVNTLLSTVNASIGLLQAKDASLDASLNFIWGWQASQDASIAKLQARDASLDASINNIYSYLDSSLNQFVKKTGDTMTGPLTINSTGGLSVAGDVSITGTHNLYVSGNTVISGNLSIDGSLFVRDVETIDVSNGYIELNTGWTGSPTANLQSGIIINRGTSDPYVFLYDESTQSFRIGVAQDLGTTPRFNDASTQAVATRQDAPIASGISYWNNVLSRFDTSAGFTFTPGVGLGLPIASNMPAEATALVWNGTTVGSRELGTMAFETSTNYVSKTVFDASLANIDSSIKGLDASIFTLNSILSGKIDAVASTTGVAGGHTIYSGEANNISYIKQIVAGSGASITDDSSTITISVAGAAGYVSKYKGTFDGTAGTSFSIPAGTHQLGTGPFSVNVYENDEEVYTGVLCADNGDVTLNWTTGSLVDASCKFVIMG